MNSLLTNRRLRRSVGALLMSTLLVRALIPLGYMPGNVFEGKFAELCPVASAATYALLPQAETNHHHVHHADSPDGSGYSIDSACPIGTSLLADVLPVFDVQFELDARPESFHYLTAVRGYVARVTTNYTARAPPLS